MDITAFYSIAQNMEVYPVFAQMTEITDRVGSILKILMAVGFIWGTVKVKKGMSSLDRGEEGILGIVSGVGIALAPILTYVGFQMLGLGEMTENISTGR